jgi:hypothetical protein
MATTTREETTAREKLRSNPAVEKLNPKVRRLFHPLYV